MFLVSERNKAGTEEEEEGEKDESSVLEVVCGYRIGLITHNDGVEEEPSTELQTSGNTAELRVTCCSSCKHMQTDQENNAANFCIVTNRHNIPWKHCSVVLGLISPVQNFTFGFLDFCFLHLPHVSVFGFIVTVSQSCIRGQPAECIFLFSVFFSPKSWSTPNSQGQHRNPAILPCTP